MIVAENIVKDALNNKSAVIAAHNSSWQSVLPDGVHTTYAEIYTIKTDALNGYFEYRRLVRVCGSLAHCSYTASVYNNDGTLAWRDYDTACDCLTKSTYKKLLWRARKNALCAWFKNLKIKSK